MGLDTVEIVMAVERRFNVRLPDSQCARATTVADLAALVIARLPRPDGVCSTARTFYQVRQLLTGHCGIERRWIRPDAPLGQFFLGKSRRQWSTLCELDPRIPRLVTSGLVDCIFLMLTAIGILSLLPASYMVGSALGPIVGIISALSLCVLGALGLERFKRLFECQLPHGLITIGDLVREVAPTEMPPTNGGDRLVAQVHVLDEVRRITAEHLALPMERVQAHSSFVKDLGC